MSSSRPAYTVSEVARVLCTATERALGQVWIKGEVIDLKIQRAGHWYFTLRDAESQLRCVAWQTYARRMRMPEEGVEVFILATPTVWTQRGELRLRVVTMLPTAGVGAQQLAFEKAKENLQRDGLLDSARKRRLPAYPQTMAVVTSAEGAVLHDIVTVARRRWPSVGIILVDAKVQGDDAADQLIAALDRVNRLEAIDLCIVARGGGASEDLAAFNVEGVCRALAGVRVPTISAVGHETDVTLADLVADLRAPTPSAAAELALPDRMEVARHVWALGNRLGNGVRHRTRVLASRLTWAQDRIRNSMVDRVRQPRRRLERLAATLDALSPLAVLARGYSVARTAQGDVVRSPNQLPPGSPFTLRVRDGDVRARSE